MLSVTPHPPCLANTLLLKKHNLNPFKVLGSPFKGLGSPFKGLGSSFRGTKCSMATGFIAESLSV